MWDEFTMERVNYNSVETQYTKKGAIAGQNFIIQDRLDGVMVSMLASSVGVMG